LPFEGERERKSAIGREKMRKVKEREREREKALCKEKT